ncbi:MAG: 50S ribosomal protein L24e [Thaumarchaeota archaeon]|nr:MAG: 50S ribosomal protein L24e [Candidatus Wolframiiraptor sp.]RLG05917.1 MAG: 50S ribosomal protein L24e [Nitrososphaerota archaeon]HDD40210.1 50S ribosomal protein L24e [Nitrososphaeria archaeon]
MSLPTTHKCAFCGREFLHGKGILYVKKDGTQLWFCSRKCRVSMIDFHRDPRKFKWTEKYSPKSV